MMAIRRAQEPGHRRCRALVALVAAAAATTCGCSSAAQDSEAGMIAAWKAHVLKPENITKHTDGEDICWLATPYLRGMVTMGEATGDRESLDAFCRGIEHLMATASKDLDGLYGWPTKKGSYGADGPRCIIMDDGHIGEPVAHFARVVRKDPDLKKAYGERAERYLRFFEERIFPKWAESWLEFGKTTTTLRWSDGAYRQVEVTFPEPAGLYRYYRPGKKPGMSLPLNQFLSVGRAYLAFYDATGKDAYLEKVRRMAVAAKAVYLVEKGDRYDPWCYWQPAWEGDFASPTEGVHWIGPHTDRPGYASGEVSMMAQLHQRGIVFTEADMRRMARLNLDVHWSKDLQNPKFGFYYERRQRDYPAVLWSSLAYLDPTIAKLAAPRDERAALEKTAGGWDGITAVPSYLLKRRE